VNVPRPSGPIRRFGAGVLVLAGLYAVMLLLSLLFDKAQGTLSALLWMVPVGGAALVVGLLTVGMRRGTRLDRVAGHVVRWWGIRGPVIRRSYPLAGFERVRLGQFQVGKGKHGRHFYVVGLEGSAKALELMQTNDLLWAGDWAARIARYLRLPLEAGEGGGSGS
jgi:hypothetical protein